MTPVELGPVQETLLIPLLGRAEETKRRRGLLRDPKAERIVADLDYDFTKWRGGASLRGTVLRTVMFDEDVRAFLERHPSGTVVELGAGLNTRYERLDNGRACWFELDLPDVIALRRRFFEEAPRRRMIAGSLLDDHWLDPVASTGGPWCFVSEAVLIYLETAEVKDVVCRLGQRFPGSWLLTDTTSAGMIARQDRHDAMRHLSRESWFRWACDDPRALEAWGLQLERTRTFLDASPAMLRRLPLPLRLVVRWLPFLIRRRLSAYHLNRFVVTAAGTGAP